MALFIDKLHLRNDTEDFGINLVSVMEGSDGAASFGYAVTQNSLRVQANRTQPISEDHNLSILVIDDKSTTPDAILTEWANTPDLFQFKASAFGGDTFLLWDESVPLTIPRQYDQIVTRKMGLTLRALPGYAGTQPLVKMPVYAGQNALSLYKVTEGNASLLNGFRVNGTMTTTQSAGSMTATRGADAAAFVHTQSIIFPFPGTRITASFTTTAHTGLGSIGFRFLDDAGALVSLDTTPMVGGAASTIRRSYTTTVPDTTYYIELYMTPGSTVGNATTFNAPAIRLDAETAYVF